MATDSLYLKAPIASNGGRVALFTPEEHFVISRWIKRPPIEPIPEGLTEETALERLGFAAPCSHYSRSDAAVAAIMLEKIQKRLPQWGAYFEGHAPSEAVVNARAFRGSSALRDVVLRPVHLFTINWATSGPGYDWPAAYHLTWLPLYDCHVVTESLDGPDAFGYCDFALGWFPHGQETVAGVRKIVIAKWYSQMMFRHQRKWECVTRPGLVTESQAVNWRGRVWPRSLR